MGNSQSMRNRNSVASEHNVGTLKQHRNVREHKRYGTAVIKIVNPVPPSGANRRPSENIITHTVTPKGTILFGTVCNANAIQNALSSSGYPILSPAELALPDSRAHRLLVTYCNGWHAIPYPEIFSRHSGTCLILGDRHITSTPFSVKVGDCFRLGSVGLVVSELKTPDQDEVRLDAKTLQFLKDEALAFDTQEDMATLAVDEEILAHKDEEEQDVDCECETVPSPDKKLSTDGAGLTNGEKYICYMCYETHNTDEDALVAPCDCKGDTRYLHVQCLQKWYQSSVCGSQAQVIRTTGNGAPACKICGAAYKSAFRRADGKKASLLEVNSDGPYISLVVVTKHDTNPGLFNTKFRLNFGRHANTPPHMTDEECNTVVIGRSSTCNMILDYRTVSTIHAKINYADGKFLLTDKKSSNGTMVYLQDPLQLGYNTTYKFRMGRTTLSVMPRRGWTSTIRSAIGAGHLADSQSGPSATDLHNILIECKNNTKAAEAAQESNFLSQRSYTHKTFNDISVDGHENGDAEYLGLGSGRGSPRGISPSRQRVASSDSVDSEHSGGAGGGGGGGHRSRRSPRGSRVRSRSNDSVGETSPRSSRSNHLRQTFIENDEDEEEREFQLAIQASLAAQSTLPGGQSPGGPSPRGADPVVASQLSSRFVVAEPDAEEYYTLSAADAIGSEAGSPSDRVSGKAAEGTASNTGMNTARGGGASSGNSKSGSVVGVGGIAGIMAGGMQRDYSLRIQDSEEDLAVYTSHSGAPGTNSSRQGTIVLSNTSALEGSPYLHQQQQQNNFNNGSSRNSPAHFAPDMDDGRLAYLPAAGAFALPGSAGKERRASGNPVETVPALNYHNQQHQNQQNQSQYLDVSVETPKVLTARKTVTAAEAGEDV